MELHQERDASGRMGDSLLPGPGRSRGTVRRGSELGRESLCRGPFLSAPGTRSVTLRVRTRASPTMVTDFSSPAARQAGSRHHLPERGAWDGGREEGALLRRDWRCGRRRLRFSEQPRHTEGSSLSRPGFCRPRACVPGSARRRATPEPTKVTAQSECKPRVWNPLIVLHRRGR